MSTLLDQIRSNPAPVTPELPRPGFFFAHDPTITSVAQPSLYSCSATMFLSTGAFAY